MTGRDEEPGGPGADRPALRSIRRRISVPDATALLSVPRGAVPGPRFYWRADDGTSEFAAIGRAAEQRFPTLDRIVVETAFPTVGSIPWCGGFAFDPSGDRTDAGWSAFPPVWFFLPQVVLRTDGGWTELHVVDASRSGARQIADRVEARLSVADGAARLPEVVLGPRDPALQDRLRRAIRAVETGRVDKVVIAAAQQGRTESPLASRDVLRSLRERAPNCTHFLVEPRPGHALVGATPERLVRVDGRRVSTMALAGSIGRSPERATDEELAAELRSSAKDAAEHRWVVESIRQRLEGIVTIDPSAQRIRKLATLQHLETPLQGDAHDAVDVLDLARRLHPTPALGGHPREAAVALIRRVERLDRGWYGGAVGWLDGDGDGDLAVAIRCLRLVDRTVTAFAGAGVVAGSSAEREAREIEWKLEAALGPLLDGGAGAVIDR